MYETTPTLAPKPDEDITRKETKEENNKMNNKNKQTTHQLKIQQFFRILGKYIFPYTVHFYILQNVFLYTNNRQPKMKLKIEFHV